MTHFGNFLVVKWFEAVISAYLLALGGMFIAIPEMLASPVYAGWREAGVATWGIILIVIGAAHVTALWWNGRNKTISRMIRFIACTMHLYACLAFASLFVSGGALWGALTFGFLMPGMIVPVLAQVIEQTKEAFNRV